MDMHYQIGPNKDETGTILPRFLLASEKFAIHHEAVNNPKEVSYYSKLPMRDEPKPGRQRRLDHSNKFFNILKTANALKLSLDS